MSWELHGIWGIGGESIALAKARRRRQAKQRRTRNDLQFWIKVLAEQKLAALRYHIFQFEVLCLILLLHFVCLNLEINEVFGNLGERKDVVTAMG